MLIATKVGYIDNEKYNELNNGIIEIEKQLSGLIKSIRKYFSFSFSLWLQAPKGFRESAAIAHRGGKIAGETRAKIEAQTGRSIVTKDKASDYLPPVDRMESLPEPDDEDD